MLAELPKTCGNKARRHLKLLRIETGKEKAKEAVQTATETLKENFVRRTG